MEDIDRALVLDGNAVGGLLFEIFAADMTAAASACAHCGRTGEVATLVAYTHSPGTVLRCPACSAVMLRIVRTPRGILVDARGAAYLRLEESPGA